MRVTLLLLTLCACAPSLRPVKADGGSDPEVDETDAGPKVVRYMKQTPVDGGTFAYVDAQSDQRWVYFDLDTGEELPSPPPATWDVGLQRFKLMTNGGISGDGGVSVARLDAGFALVTQAPLDGYVVDQPDSDDEGTVEDLAFLTNPAWYEYESHFHSLAARDYTYVVRSTEARYFKLRMTGYYDDNGTSGFLQFLWAPIDAPDAG